MLTESAFVEARLGQWEKAILLQSRAEMLDPLHKKVRQNQLRFAALQNDNKELRRLAQEFLAEYPEDSFALFALGLTAKDEGSLEEAERQLRRVALNQPTHPLFATEARTVQWLRHPFFYPLLWVRKIQVIPLIAAFVIAEEWFRLSRQYQIAIMIIVLFLLYWLYVIGASKLLDYLSKRTKLRS